MTQIRLDAMMSAQLHQLAGPVELCDPAGRVLGCFVPSADLTDWVPVMPEVSEAELDRREASAERRYSTAEVVAHLERL
jgi:hypothetical protein